MTDIKTHGSYAYNVHRCRCDVCRAGKAKNTKATADRKKAARPKPISFARDLRIIARTKPVLEPTFTPTPVDDCGEFIARGVYCRRLFPCAEHGGDQ